MRWVDEYRPTIDDDRIAALRAWHERSHRQLREAGEQRVRYLGLDLVAPPGVFAPTAVSDLLGGAVLAEVRAGDRVLDMGTGSGVNAILAARTARDVVGVDVNPAAVDAARANAHRNGVLATFVVSDVFDAVEGTFDLIVVDPPFRWFAPRDMVERAITDAGYATLQRFLAHVGERLRPGGRVLLFFGTTGDLDHVLRSVARAGLDHETVASRDIGRGGASYSTYRLTRRPAP